MPRNYVYVNLPTYKASVLIAMVSNIMYAMYFKFTGIYKHSHVCISRFSHDGSLISVWSDEYKILVVWLVNNLFPCKLLPLAGSFT